MKHLFSIFSKCKTLPQTFYTIKILTNKETFVESLRFHGCRTSKTCLGLPLARKDRSEYFRNVLYFTLKLHLIEFICFQNGVSHTYLRIRSYTLPVCPLFFSILSLRDQGVNHFDLNILFVCHIKKHC